MGDGLRRQVRARRGTTEHPALRFTLRGSVFTGHVCVQVQRRDVGRAQNLFVLDGSAFSSASGVNPMVSIEALAHMNAMAPAQRLK